MKKHTIYNAIKLALIGASTIGSVAPLVAAEKSTNDALSQIERQAKESEENKAEKSEIEKITVTGSRIRRDSFSVATPLSILNKDTIADSGIGSLSEILVDEVPQITEGTSNTNSQSNITATGLSTIDLRELGTSRTLTLIDGRRVVSNSHSGSYVSLSTIPTGMVERVEVITGGASAAYGSDAIAGVVNIITQQDKEGFSANVRHGESFEGGAKELTFDLDYGTEFAGGRGYLFASGSFDKQYGLTFAQRERAQQQDSIIYDDDEMCNAALTEDGYQCLRDISQSDWRSLSDSIPGGVFDEQSSSRPDAGFWYDANGLRDDWHEERYGINTNQFVMLKVPDEATTAAIKIDFEVNEDVEFYFQSQFAVNKSFNNKAPESEDESDLVITFDPQTGEFGEADIGRIPTNNPYVPDVIREQASSRGIKWDRNFAEVGNIATDNVRETLRSWAGLKGTAFDGEWDWDISLGYGRFTQDQIRTNEINVAKARQALNAEYAPDGVTIQCADANARAEGCAPLNLFGEGSISKAAADYIRANPRIESEVEQISVLGYMAGDLFELPAGPVATAFGFEYREDSQSLQVSGGAENGYVTFNYVPSYSGEIKVSEVFGEASIPLLANVTGAKSLSAELSLRLADYSWATSGLVQSYKAGFIWQPVAGYAVRANWARAQRAPAIDDLMSPVAGDYDSFDDICDGVTATSTDAGHDNCRKEPSISNWLAANPGEEFVDNNNSYSPSLGNMDLQEETADTYTFGFTAAPAFLPNFQLAVDYYDISIKDAISSYDNEDIIEFCYDSALAYGSSNSFCQDIKRDEEGNIIEVKQRAYNVDEIATSGVDVAISYSYDLGEYGGLKFKADYTNVLEYTQTVAAPSGPETTYYESDLSADLFEHTASASVAWSYENLRVRWSTKYKSSVTLSRSDVDDWQSYMDKNAENCAANEDSCISNPEPLASEFYDLPEYFKHNLSVSYLSELANGSEVRVYGGVNNVFDDNGPFILGGKGNYDGNYGGGVGRFYYLGAEYSF